MGICIADWKSRQASFSIADANRRKRSLRPAGALPPISQNLSTSSDGTTSAPVEQHQP
jgi:hypothetical protein